MAAPRQGTRVRKTVPPRSGTSPLSPVTTYRSPSPNARFVTSFAGMSRVASSPPSAVYRRTVEQRDPHASLRVDGEPVRRRQAGWRAEVRVLSHREVDEDPSVADPVPRDRVDDDERGHSTDATRAQNASDDAIRNRSRKAASSTAVSSEVTPAVLDR